ncbi:MAG: DUF3536 domain-containing protein [Nitrospirae bacterium]|nr:DUF3536 domain-containing protein [Nitrospirota bacterium]
MERFICIHGHFYQPPRENPWLEQIEIQDSAYPYHDWNERVSVECYAPNSASRLLDGEGRIKEIVNNYSRISFNFGPTLLSWMEAHAPEVYAAILAADKQSVEARSGHGNALAQAYNHLIMPLANSRDKRTQVLWAIRDFTRRFRRPPEGMWLPETAVDVETLDILAECGIRFTVLAPHQAARTRKIGEEEWVDANGGQIDPSQAYLCPLPSGRALTLFFYDGPIARAVAFEGLLGSGRDFVNRLVAGFSDVREGAQLVTIATDGESYGHHHKFGDMALAYALNAIESGGETKLTNYGEYLEQNPPLREVQIYENTSWSCVHGIERWRSNCGCNSGGNPAWNQEWRAPLREALDRLRDELSPRYEEKAKQYMRDPWMARDGYIDVIIDRSEGAREEFFGRHATRSLTESEKIAVLKLMELQRHAMLMYTSCGWFFGELSGIETVQILCYAGRVVQLALELFGVDLEAPFKEGLAEARSNQDGRRDGAHVYEELVGPSRVDLERVTAHYAISSLLGGYDETAGIYCYSVRKEDYGSMQSGAAKLALGRVEVTSQITLESDTVIFCALHLGGHVFNGGLRKFSDPGTYQSMKQEVIATFEQGEIAGMIRLMDNHFGMHTYSLIHLFRDEQRKILNLVIDEVLEQFEHASRPLFEDNRTLMAFLGEAGMPTPEPFCAAAAFILNRDLKKAFSKETPDIEKIKGILSEIGRWEVPLDSVSAEFMLRSRGEEMIAALSRTPAEFSLLSALHLFMELLPSLPVEVNLWKIQNLYYKMAQTVYGDFSSRAIARGAEAARWVELFRAIGEKLSFSKEVTSPAG